MTLSRNNPILNEMNLPNKITLVRIVLAPIFFLLFFLPRWVPNSGTLCIIFIWIVWGTIELSDIADGALARKRGLESAAGKFLDPVADVVSHLTIFLCFILVGVMPGWIFLILLYRELGVSFLRLFALGRGITFGAYWPGKIKTIVYALAAFNGMFLYTVMSVRMPITFPLELGLVQKIVFVFFLAAACISIISFGLYVIMVFEKQDKRV